MAHPDVGPCTRMYVEAAALGLLGREPYASVARQANALWTAELAAHVRRSGAPEHVAERVAVLVDAAFMGFQLDLGLEAGEGVKSGAVADLAAAVKALTVGS